jgi:hypothetical protein
MPTVYARTVRRAAEIVGSVEVLAAQLEVRDPDLRKWMEGQLSVPQEIFLRCVDILNAHQLNEIGGSHANSLPKRPA